MELIYYFSPGSRYSYLSLSQLPAIESEFGVEFSWVPVNGKRIRTLRGADPFSGPALSGQYEWDYRQRDAEAWADYYGVAFQEPDSVEFDAELLCRAVIAASHQGATRPYAWELASEVFGRGTWPLDDEATRRVASKLSLDLAAFDVAMSDPATHETLVENCRAAVDRGTFGKPTLFVDGQMFWGNDRLVLVRHALAKRLA